MAVQPWELVQEPAPRPQLELVPAPPRGGRTLPALLFVVLLIGTIGFPAMNASTAPPSGAISWHPRPLPLSQISAIDPVTPLNGTNQPRSREPAGGILFVSCTNLWTALPDGSHRRKLIEFPGVSSPTFSPDGRTIAFVGPGAEGQSLYMVGGDGSGLTEIGPFSHQGDPVGARIANLTWSQRGDKLAFALLDPFYDLRAEGSTLWMLDLSEGEFERIASGSPTPAFLGGRVAYSEIDPSRGRGAGFTATGARGGSMTRRLSTPGDDLSFGSIAQIFSNSWRTRHGAAVLRRTTDGELELAVKPSAWTYRIFGKYRAPSPYEYSTTGHISFSQETRRVVVDLVDPKGDRAMGILDLSSDDWTVIDYAWNGVATPAPTTSGRLAEWRAEQLGHDFFGSWNRRSDRSAAALLLGHRDRKLIRGGGGYLMGDPTKIERGWSIPAALYVRKDRKYRFQNARLDLTRTKDGRVEADVTATSDDAPLETVADAKTFLSEILDGDPAFVWPTYLPEGTRLNERWPVDAYRWGSSMVATVHLTVPHVEGESYDRTINVAYGDVSFSLGCGGENNPEESEVGEEPGLYDHVGQGPGGTRQILWPATMDQRDLASYSVYGEGPREMLQRVAESMAAQR
jgi:WD40-like Beta Propeller Repeat